MSNEIFDINNVKQEFLQNMGPEYVKVFSEKQLEMSVYMLNEFCDALIGNGLVLTRQPEVRSYNVPPTPQMGIPPQYQQQPSSPQYYQPTQFQQQQPYQDPFQEQQLMQQQIKELNSQLPRRPQQPMDNNNLPPIQEVDLNVDKPKSFADKIREMRAGTKKPNRINPDDNE